MSSESSLNVEVCSTVAKICSKTSRKQKHGYLPAVKKYKTRFHTSNRRKPTVPVVDKPFFYGDNMADISKKITEKWKKPNILERLYVEDSPMPIKTVKTIEPDYFSTVEGRPVNRPFTRREYVDDLRQTLMLKIERAYIRDHRLETDEQIIEEQSTIDQTRVNYRAYVKSFEKFLSEDHSESMKLLQEAQRLAKISNENELTYVKLSERYRVLKVNTYVLEERWRNLKLYQKFLYHASPMWWRLEHDTINLNLTGRFSFSHERAPSMVEQGAFDEYRGDANDVQSIESFIDFYRKELKIPPQLCFNEPRELLEAFRVLELQNLNALQHAEEMALPVENTRVQMHRDRRLVMSALTEMRGLIEQTERDIEWYETRSKNLETKTNALVNGLFKRLVANDDILRKYAYIEDVYEAIVAPNTANLDAVEMFRAIESVYAGFLLERDALPSDAVSKSQHRYNITRVRTLRAAEDAYRKMELITRLALKLKTLLEPPRKSRLRPLPFRSAPIKPRANVHKPRAGVSLTDEQRLCLDFFTEYCPGDDLTGFDLNNLRLD